MTQQEPGPWELQRRLDKLDTSHQASLDKLDASQQARFDRLDERLDRLVTTEAFAAEQRRTDEKIKDVADALAEERRQRAQNLQDEKHARERALEEEKKQRKEGDANQQTALDKLVATQRWVIVAILVPVGLFLANLYLSTQG